VAFDDGVTAENSDEHLKTNTHFEAVKFGHLKTNTPDSLQQEQRAFFSKQQAEQMKEKVLSEGIRSVIDTAEQKHFQISSLKQELQFKVDILVPCADEVPSDERREAPNEFYVGKFPTNHTKQDVK